MPESSTSASALPEGFRQVHREVMAIRRGDMVAMMHVDSTVYLRFMGQVRIGWIESRGGGNGAGSLEGPVIAGSACRFKRPHTYPGAAVVRMHAGKIGRSRVPNYYEIRRTDDAETVYATGEALFVRISNQSGRPVAFPAPLRIRLGRK